MLKNTRLFLLVKMLPKHFIVPFVVIALDHKNQADCIFNPNHIKKKTTPIIRVVYFILQKNYFFKSAFTSL
jgi:hypothetical protein